MTNLTQTLDNVQDPNEFLDECRRAAQKRREEREAKEARRKAKELEKEREELLRMIEKRLDLSRTHLTIVEGQPHVRYGELTFHRQEQRIDRYYGVDLIATRPDPDSEDHILRSYDIKSREDLGTFLDGYIAKRDLTKEAFERKEAEEEENYEPTPRHEKEASAPARPVFTTNQHGEMYIQNKDRGFTKREAIAAMALQGYCASEPVVDETLAAQAAAKAADALLKALHGESGGQES